MKKIVNILKSKDFQKKFWFTLGLLAIYELGSMITLPGVDKTSLGIVNNNSFMQIINMIGAGSIDKMSIFALGVTPYITASIVVQLLSSDVIPYLTNLKEQGIKGQIKLDRITRILSIALAFIQGYGFCLMYGSTVSIEEGIIATRSIFVYGGILPILFTCFMMTVGTLIAIWFGDLLTLYGLGNGISVLICAGIFMRLPNQMLEIFTSLVQKQDYTLFVLYLLSVLLLIVFVVILQQAERRIPIWDPSSRIKELNDKDTNYLPLKVNTPGVMPIIFASTLMVLPIQVLQLTNKTDWLEKVGNFFNLQTWYSILIYGVLVLMFSFFYAKIQIEPKKVSESLTKRNCYIPGFKPGEETEIYINKVMNHIMIFGSIGLLVVALLPYILPMFTPLSSSTAIGGTSILIIIGVLIELYSQIRNTVNKDRYEKFRIKTTE